MQHFYLFAATESQGIAAQTAKQFGLDLPHFLTQLVSFLLVAGLLYKFAYKRILDLLDERRRRIEEGLANA